MSAGPVLVGVPCMRTKDCSAPMMVAFLTPMIVLPRTSRMLGVFAPTPVQNLAAVPG